MTEHADPRKIEADIERDRASLASTLDTLQDRVSVDAIAREALGMISSNAASLTRSVDQAVRANPMALALTAAGIAWLVFGARKTEPAQKPVHQQSLQRWEDEGGPVSDAGTIDTSDWTAKSDGMRRSASDKLRQIESDARDAVTGKLEQARDFAAERAGVLAELTKDLTGSLRHGLSDLTESAQDKIASARATAYSAAVRAESMARDTTRQAGRTIEDHPMVTGAIALALGAALGAALPRSRIEDRTFGPERDRLMTEATRMLSEERARAGQIAGGLGAEVTSAARDMLGAVTNVVTDKALGALDRVTAAASDELVKPQNTFQDPVHETHRQG